MRWIWAQSSLEGNKQQTKEMGNRSVVEGAGGVLSGRERAQGTNDSCHCLVVRPPRTHTAIPAREETVSPGVGSPGKGDKTEKARRLEQYSHFSPNLWELI